MNVGGSRSYPCLRPHSDTALCDLGAEKSFVGQGVQRTQEPQLRARTRSHESTTPWHGELVNWHRGFQNYQLDSDNSFKTAC